MMAVKRHSFVFILGMHRSGTSCLAGALERCGLHMGNVRRTGRFNAKGYYELKEVEHIHDQILGLNRGAWHSPPRQVQVHPYHCGLLANIAEQLSIKRPCGIKDPRLLLFLDTWLEIAPRPHALVGTFRHPISVSRSLAKRNNIPEADALDLWLRYNQILVRRHQANPFPLIEFDLSDMEGYCKSIESIAYLLGLRPNFFQLQQFVSEDLMNYGAGKTMPLMCCETYDYLQQCCFSLPNSAIQKISSRKKIHLLQTKSNEKKRFIGMMREASYRAKHYIASYHERFLKLFQRIIDNRRRWNKENLQITSRFTHSSACRFLLRLYNQRFVLKTIPVDFSNLRFFLLFIGNPRSGTTLVRSLLDAHPNILLGNEVHVLRRIENGENWSGVAGRIIANAKEFSKNPTWSGYSYRITGKPINKNAKIHVLGDKKAGGTIKYLLNNSTLLSFLVKWSSVPIKFIHCVRHPLDVIATKTRRNKFSIEHNVDRYFQFEQAASYYCDILGSHRFIRVYHEKMIEDPILALNHLFDFLGQMIDDNLLHKIQSGIYTQPHQSRRNFDWTPAILADIQDRTQKIQHLHCYLNPRGEMEVA